MKTLRHEGGIIVNRSQNPGARTFHTVILNSFQNLKEMLKQVQHDKDQKWGLLDEI